jgi:hypothetical protein
MTQAWNDIIGKNRTCSAANQDTDAKYVNALANVQDMMHFTGLQAAAGRKDPESALINYYSVPFGSLIGHTLVATYQDHTNRILFDANMYSVGYYRGWEPFINLWLRAERVSL